MNETDPQMFSIRAIEDIIQIQKLIDDSPNLKTIQLGKEKSYERVVYSVLKHDISSGDTANHSLGSLLKDEAEQPFKCNDKNCKKLDFSGWESDYSLTKYINPDVVVLENFGLIDSGSLEPDVKCWSSDSDVTVLRVKKEFRNELSNKMEWEEQRNLADDVSFSSTNLHWETHSLINLAGVVGKEKDVQENLTPFTIWSKTSSGKKSMENKKDVTIGETISTEIKLAVDKALDFEKMEKENIKKKRFRKLFQSLFCCFSKKKFIQ